MTKTALTLSAFAAALYLTVPAWAADYAAPASGCAVSETNLKVEAAGGAVDLGDDFDSEGAVRGIGSLSLPLGCMFGAQFDAGAAHFDGTTFAGIGGHLFMRDPTSHLLGIAASYADGEDMPGVWRVGPEAELYLSNFSLEAWAGVEDSNDTSADFFAAIDGAVYLTPDLRLSLGWRHSMDSDAGVLGAEYQLSSMPVSVFAEGTLGEDEYKSIFGGIRFHFGPQKDLMSRHREDDPRAKLFDYVGAGAGLTAQQICENQGGNWIDFDGGFCEGLD